MPVKLTLLISVTTDPTNRAAAAAHSGGWSESFYWQQNTFLQQGDFQLWANARATLLAAECSVTGYRQQNFTIQGNRLLPGGGATGVVLAPGTMGANVGPPQSSLMVSFTITGQPQSVRHKLAGLPESMISNGEYQPTPAFAANVTKYISFVTGNTQNSPFKAAGITRDLTQPSCQVSSIVPGADNTAVITTLSPTGTAVGGFIRLHRVKDTAGDPVIGVWPVTVVTPGAGTMVAYTVTGYLTAQAVTKPNGLARNDLLVVNSLAGGTPNRLVVRKIGRPFVQYRGRRSKRPVT